MTPADLARANAISFEGVKTAYRQTKDGVVVSFVVHPNDVPDGLAVAPLGTRYQAVLVEIDDCEQPVQRAEVTSPAVDAKPQPKDKPAGAKQKQDWTDMLPSAQAAMLGAKRSFQIFLQDEHPFEWDESRQDPAEAIRLVCQVSSRSQLNNPGRERKFWENLQTEYHAWLQEDQVIA